MKKIFIPIFIAILLGGCGDVEWFPGPATGTSTPAAIERVEVGTLVTSVRIGAGDYTVTTTKGVFSAYTSLSVPYQTPVAMESYTDPVTGLQIGKVLRALQQTILVKSVLALVK